jgi:hypothetical protein
MDNVHRCYTYKVTLQRDSLPFLRNVHVYASSSVLNLEARHSCMFPRTTTPVSCLSNQFCSGEMRKYRVLVRHLVSLRHLASGPNVTHCLPPDLNTTDSNQRFGGAYWLPSRQGNKSAVGKSVTDIRRFGLGIPRRTNRCEGRCKQLALE